MNVEAFLRIYLFLTLSFLLSCPMTSMSVKQNKIICNGFVSMHEKNKLVVAIKLH